MKRKKKMCPVSQASKLYFDNEEFIKKEIKRLRGITGKPTPEERKKRDELKFQYICKRGG